VREAVSVLQASRVEALIEKQDDYDELESSIIKGISARVSLSDMNELSRNLPSRGRTSKARDQQ